MNYPVWQLDGAGGGLLIALMAIFHVYVAHFAVGGGLFLVMTEMKGIRENNQAIIDFVRRHTKFFLLLTMVAGGMTGVGIWFTISLLNPAATSKLIHLFVFAWGIEWVFFTAEILSLFIYYYTFGRMDNRNHVIIGWIYFGCAWLSLFVINGIIDFMLTPGAWLQNNNFWSALFNPTFWPALFFRSFLAFMLAGLYGFLTAVNLKDVVLRVRMVRYCALWLIAPFLLFLGSAWWYRAALPPELQVLIFERMPEIKPYLDAFIILGPMLMLGGLIMAIRMPQSITRPIAAVMLVLGLLYMGSFEFIREAGRRPYIIRDHMYSTSILKKDMELIQQNGFLQEAKWVSSREVTRDNMMTAGRELFNNLCLPCHSVGGPLNDIRKVTGNYTPRGLEAKIGGIHNFSPYMPPFAGSGLERKALAYYIAYGLNNRRDRMDDVAIREIGDEEIPAFNGESDKYVLLAWSDMGMKSYTDASGSWMILPPGGTINAQLIERGETPDVIVDGVTISYAVDPEFSDPAQQVDFWQNAAALYDREIAPNTGLSGNGLTGVMKPGEEWFTVSLLPVVPYTAERRYMPYPAFTVTAVSSAGEVLAATRVVAPVATEMGCQICHGGHWAVDNRAGLSVETAENILAAHDRISGTNLQGLADNNMPVLCNCCHADSSQDAPGNKEQLNLSAAIHGFHANFLGERGAMYCVMCHPADSGGATRSFRGIHRGLGLNCTYCHGEIEDHAISLLKAEHEQGKERAAVLLGNIRPANFESVDAVVPRRPWVNQPDCLDCHEGFQAPEVDTTFNRWTAGEEDLYRNRTDESGRLRCAACHGSPHAVYPAMNPYSPYRDVLQPMQYQGQFYPIGSNMNCKVCHTIDMEYEMHHPNMLREFRNQ
ncbi:MAG: cytochrome ubiquinol oxidase subunit I [Desulfobulbaceae bacterium]|nr:cytochrome ubiquinol oxidase subunit I [Desulfobulbaceae bacterium]